MITLSLIVIIVIVASTIMNSTVDMRKKRQKATPTLGFRVVTIQTEKNTCKSKQGQLFKYQYNNKIISKLQEEHADTETDTHPPTHTHTHTLARARAHTDTETHARTHTHTHPHTSK